ncbi:MAG: adenylate kinase [Candidatus Nanopelagicales bacterium]
MKLLIMGPPGAGKGTQAKFIAEKFAIPHISTGDIFRENLKKETAIGLEAKSYMDRGEYVPDEVTNRIVADRLTWDDAAKGFLLDGYPRTLDQVNFLEQTLSQKNQHLDRVIELVADINTLIARLLSRAKEQNRADDTEEVITKRLEVYLAETAPIIETYKKKNLVIQINGLGEIEEVSHRIITAIENK